MKSKIKNDFLVISDNRVIKKILISEIVHVESKGMHSSIYTSSGERHTCSRNLGSICKELTLSGNICRVHTSFAINMDKIDLVKTRKNSFVLMKTGALVPVSKRKKHIFFMRYLKKYSTH